MCVCVLVNSIYSIWMGSTSKAAFHWINIEFDVKKKTLDSGNKNDLLYLMYEMKMLYHFICIIVYKPRPNSLSLLMIRLFLFDSHPILRFWFHLIQILQRHNSQNL